MRRVTLEVEGDRWQAVVEAAVHLSVPMTFDGPQPKAFGLPDAEAQPIAFDESICDTDRGGAFNCSSVRLIPHGNGTHTECIGHLRHDTRRVGELADDLLMPASVVSVEPTPYEETDETYPVGEAGDRVVTRERLADAIASLDLPDGFLRSLVIRTTPNPPEKRQRDYSGKNPPYLTREAIDWVHDAGPEHLLVDLPSIDRERDGGRLANHRAFWEADERASVPSRRTLTELCYVPNDVEDGVFFLHVDIPDFALDAAPSRPLLYEAIPLD